MYRSSYNVTYHEDGTIESFLPNDPSAPERIRKQVVMEVTDAPYPMKPVVPFIKATQDRGRTGDPARLYPRMPFLSAGMIYRPTRERRVETLKEYARAMLKKHRT